jgi:chromate reductase, NAD(P)H dehydrogenase (quinone)
MGFLMIVGEKEGTPEAVDALKDRIAACDGLLLVTPEYNNPIPGISKNAIDWISRPPQDQLRVFHHRSVRLIGATPGYFGTAFSQTAWLPVLRLLKLRVWFGDLLWVSRAMKVFDADGNLADEKIRKRLGQYLEGFAEFAGGSE